MNTENISSNPEKLSENGCCLIPDLIAEDLVTYISTQVEIDEIYRIRVLTDQVNGSREVYNTPGMQILNQLIRERLQKLFNIPRLVSTYTFYRKYYRGQELTRHSDRPECEFSVTLCLNMAEKDKPWPVYFESTKQGIVYIAEPKIGDAVAYLGPQLPHWRDPCEQAWLKQMFLHYSTNPYLEFDNNDGEKDEAYMVTNHFIRHLIECHQS